MYKQALSGYTIQYNYYEYLCWDKRATLRMKFVFAAEQIKTNAAFDRTLFVTCACILKVGCHGSTTLREYKILTLKLPVDSEYIVA